MKCTTIWQEGDHRWLVLSDDPDKPDSIIDTNQIVVASEDGAILLDPGGIEVFPAVVAAVSQEIDLHALKHLFLSHQDPDVASSLPLWRQVCAEGTAVHVSWMWTGFVSHFDSQATFAPIPDAGNEIVLSPRVRLKTLPAHYLHSSGCFCVWDPVAKVLFSGDIGAAVLPKGSDGELFIADFNAHTRFMEGFHCRWMGCAEARDKWVAMVRKLAPDFIIPQHGKAFRGEDVGRFLDWLAQLPLAGGLASFDQAIADL